MSLTQTFLSHQRHPNFTVARTEFEKRKVTVALVMKGNFSCAEHSRASTLASELQQLSMPYIARSKGSSKTKKENERDPVTVPSVGHVIESGEKKKKRTSGRQDGIVN